MEFTELFDTIWETLIKEVYRLYPKARMNAKNGPNKTSYTVLVTNDRKKNNIIFSFYINKSHIEIHFANKQEYNARLIGSAIDVAVHDKFPEEEFDVWYA